MQDLSLIKLKKCLNEDRKIIVINNNEYSGIDINNLLNKILPSFSFPKQGAIGIICSKGLNFILGLFSSILLNRDPIYFPVNGSIDFYEKHILNGVCSIIICDREEVLQVMKDRFEIRKISGFYICCDYNFKNNRVSEDCFGQFTSGTTDIRKLVIRPSKSLEMEINSLEKFCHISKDATFFNMAPLFHSYGYCGGLIWPLCRGSKVYIVDSFMPTQCKKIWNKVKPSVVYGIPYQYEMFLQTPGDNLSEVDYMFSAGSPIAKSLRSAFYKKFGLLFSINYGSTEFGTICVYPKIPLELEADHVGFLLQHFRKAYVVDDEIFLDCDEKSYYFQNNADVISTGDIGEIKNTNELIIKSRVRKIINIAGEKVDPSFVERIIKNITSVTECLVYGKKISDSIELVVAYVESSILKESELIDYCKKHLSSYEIPREMHIVTDLKRTTTGKLSIDYYRSLSQEA